MNILITGGCGFVGTVLTTKLLADGHRITVVDTQWFGNHLTPHPELTVLKQDTRAVDSIPLKGIDTIIHLANIANDPGVEMNPTLSWEVNVLATQQLADRAVRADVKHFIFASSGSVYGVKDEPQVTEDLELVPISAYNKTKMVAERVLLSYTGDMQIHCVRPATVCGYSPRMRLDVSVNMLTMQALTNGKMTVFGGDQTRPNIHINDMVNVYRNFLAHPELPSGCYNAGFENISIIDIAKMVATKIPSEIVVSASNDPRSYRQNSDKLLATGFARQFSVADAINDLAERYKAGQLVENDQYYTVRWMKHLNLQA
ncbi:MAG TPA: SDR family oxidoreductase [Burkholderiaceae bacterium]|jgi:nucleoside-diphosphate-sugar epimerase|nr:SDR family oxidoreductase [Burkholderiaceae bacterium]